MNALEECEEEGEGRVEILSTTIHVIVGKMCKINWGQMKGRLIRRLLLERKLEREREREREQKSLD